MKNLLFVCLSIFTTAIVSFSQNVGIGTTNPQTKLHVTGTAMADTMKINNYSNPATQPAYIVSARKLPNFKIDGTISA